MKLQDKVENEKLGEFIVLAHKMGALGCEANPDLDINDLTTVEEAVEAYCEQDGQVILDPFKVREEEHRELIVRAFYLG